jgi:hypothetical protein
MTLTHVELYEALRPHVGDEAARMMAEVIPPSADLATKLDIGEVRREVSELRGEVREGFAMLRAEIAASQASTLRWMVAMFVPMWAGAWATVAAVILKS